MRPRLRSRDARGAAALELALVLPVLVMLLLGVVTAGVTYSHGIGLANAVREGSRFGATGISTSPTYFNDVISRTRATQFDDSNSASTSATSVCVQLWKFTTAGSNAGAGTATCSLGEAGVAPSLSSMPGKDSYPMIPPASTAGTCVVRVLAERNYSIALGVLPDLNGTLVRGSVARYERSSC